MNRINFTIGDWSGDGHAQTQTRMIETNLTKKEIEIAYDVGTAKLGFNFVEEICASYEDDVIDFDKLEILREHGFKQPLFEEQYENEDDCIGIDCDEYLQMYLFIASLGNKNFKYEFVDNNENEITIGGYGLFS